MKGVYKIFVRDRELINIIDTKYMDKFLELGLRVYFGDLFGKYEDFSYVLQKDNVVLLSTDEEDVKVITRLGLTTYVDLFGLGVNSFPYDDIITDVNNNDTIYMILDKIFAFEKENEDFNWLEIYNTI
mgnify:FL=1